MAENPQHDVKEIHAQGVSGSRMNRECLGPTFLTVNGYRSMLPRNQDTVIPKYYSSVYLGARMVSAFAERRTRPCGYTIYEAHAIADTTLG